MFIVTIKRKKEELADIEEMLSETDDKEEVEMLKRRVMVLKLNFQILKKSLKDHRFRKILMMTKTLFNKYRW